MPTEKRELYIDPGSPMPQGVDGAFFTEVYYDDDEVEWDEEESDPFVTGMTVEEDDDSQSIDAPVPLEIVETIVRNAVGGNSYIQATLLIEEVPGIEDYEIRVSQL